MKVKARAMAGPTERFETIEIERRDLRPDDVLIDIAFSGVCHSDVHHARASWGSTTFPIVPGHEIAGHVAAVGSEVTGHRVGDRVGVGCLVNSCGHCQACANGEEQYCDQDVLTYNATDYDGSRTFGGYSEQIVVKERFVVQIPESIPLDQAAPLMCAGITLYSPLRRFDAGPDTRVGILGLGGLGHLGVQISAALGAPTVVFDVDATKAEAALRLGAREFIAVSPGEPVEFERSSLDLIISTVPAPLDLDGYLGLLALGGTFVNLGVPPQPLSIVAHSLLRNRRNLAGSLIGGIAETQEMLEFCAASGVGCEVEVVGAGELDVAYDRLERGDVRYRFVLNIGTIRDDARDSVSASSAAYPS